MQRMAALLLSSLSAVFGQVIYEYPLNPYSSVDLPVSREVTTITLPGPITAVVAADMLTENGRSGVTEVEEGTTLRFHLTHAPDSNFVLVRSLQPNAQGR